MALANWMLLADRPQVEEKEIFIDRHRMHCLVAGNGPSLLLLHGLLGSAEAWTPCLHSLGEESTACAIDTLGIGCSERVPGLNAGLAAQADRIAQFIENVGIEKTDVVGTSHGGAIAMMLAARHPELVRSLILHAPANPFSNLADPLLHFYRSPLGHWFAYYVPNLPETLQELALGRMYGNTKLIRDEVREMYMRSLRVPGTVDHVLDILDRWFDDMWELEQAIATIRDMQVLLVWGTRDRAVSLASGQRLKKMFDNAEMIVLPGVGHLPYEEAPEAFADAVNGFLRRRRRPQLVRSHG